MKERHEVAEENEDEGNRHSMSLNQISAIGSSEDASVTGSVGLKRFAGTVNRVFAKPLGFASKVWGKLRRKP